MSEQAFVSPLVSVVVPIHNGALWIQETLDSLLHQSYRNLEVLLIDDASTDDLRGVLATFDDPRLRVERLTVNGGVSAARNVGIQMACGEFIAFCDADDIALEHRIEAQVQLLNVHPEVDLCGTAFTCFDAVSESVVRHPKNNAEIRRALMTGNCFGLSTVLARSEVLKMNLFDESLGLAEDYDLWTRLAIENTVFANIQESLVRYRLHGQQASKGKGERLDIQSRRVRARYCAALLRSDALNQTVASETIAMVDMRFAANLLTERIQSLTGFETSDFRFLLAWMYQRLDSHGPFNWTQWKKLQRQLNLRLNLNYRLNNFLLALCEPLLSPAKRDLLLKLKT
ncbi:glycosyltransferase [Rhodoferax sp. GW822-FHT02A01]|uniref:glycosyltransferase family 2 protein n=1 Tax=Rhodoferax sp. GW822-FHT02A01 TaxID=3141537 RepID=UPI00315DF7D8